MTNATIKKWGNSLALRIPNSFASQIGIKEDSQVTLEIRDDHLIIKPGKTLDEMLAAITDENRHELVDMGEPQGKEMI